ncbi:G1 to S phase transition protein, putative [Eimeria tenella]|uniref:G1 to S phase transition protein, putative n=1 Tax=Eimeria tenella TaxID=5802 RepID=U6KIR1_EIMTE|nr:G1 to S phase transition protein, putative [Eimeria tenella]CDJ37895.1 G1 to S phase transition protein, putative [Eimeria tenella]|eukprot:XP_013228733.1 G1 to S phase transition protein, putative [Eimeria tenella]
MSKYSFNTNAPEFIPGRPFVLPTYSSKEPQPSGAPVGHPEPQPGAPPVGPPEPQAAGAPLGTPEPQPAGAPLGAPEAAQVGELCKSLEAASVTEKTWEDEAEELAADPSSSALDAGCCSPRSPASCCAAAAAAAEVEGSDLEGEEGGPGGAPLGGPPGAPAGKTPRRGPDARPHLNIVFIGHVDAGKSTTCGNILFLTGGVDVRTIEKYEKEAKDKNRDSWFLAFVMDTNEEERQKGKTVEVGRAAFSTPNRRFTLLDAPGHKAFVPNMIEGAAQADVGVLIISARKGEFETGFEKGGQTREHTLLAKTLGVCQLVVAVNKMDESTCQWSEERYREIQRKTKTFFQNCGFIFGKNLSYIPISGLAGQNLKCHVSRPGSPCFEPRASWYSPEEPTLFEVLDSLNPPPRNPDAPLRIPILDGYKDNGVTALGKVEAGTVTYGMEALLLPQKKRVKVGGVFLDEAEVAAASVGENVRLKLLGCEEDALAAGAVLCSPARPCPVAARLLAYAKVLDLLEHRPLLTAGYACVMHVHTAREEVVLGRILEKQTRSSSVPAESSDGKKKKTNPQFVTSDCLVSVEIILSKPMCMEEYEACSQLGRFTLRDEGKTIAAGRVTKILEFA